MQLSYEIYRSNARSQYSQLDTLPIIVSRKKKAYRNKQRSCFFILRSKPKDVQFQAKSDGLPLWLNRQINGVIKRWAVPLKKYQILYKATYKLDRDYYLLDDKDHYLLDNNECRIQLSPEHIALLHENNLLEWYWAITSYALESFII